MSNYDILKAYIFEKNQKIVDKFPDNLDTSITNNPHYNRVNIPDNKGDNGNIGNVDFSYDVIEYEKKCNNCTPNNIVQKTKIENINNNGDITISPSININNSLLVSEKIRIDDYNIIRNNINQLNNLLSRDLKCDQGEKLINVTDTSIGECVDCNDGNLSNIVYTTNTCDWECDTNYTINQDNDECLRICDPGYKRDNGHCEPCDIDYYKSDSNIDTSCSPCPTGSTTGNNNTATAITDCTAKPGYEDDGNIYTPKPGNVIMNNKLFVCNNNYYYDNYDCKTCGPFGDGIVCNTSNIVNSKRTLISGYGLRDNTSYPCDGNHYRNGEYDIDYDVTNLVCNECPTGSRGNNSEDDSNGPNYECTLLPGYDWNINGSSPPNYEVTLKPGNIDSKYPYTGTIVRCDNGYYYNGTECETCGPQKDGIECNSGDIQNAKKMLLAGYSSTIEEFTEIKECDAEREYRHTDVEYSDTSSIPCTECPIGSKSNTDNNACDLNNGYEWKTNKSTAPNYEVTLKPGNIDNNTDGTIDGCSQNYYYNGNECETCEQFGEGITCLGNETLDSSNRTLQPRYSWNGSTAEPCDNEYRLGDKVIDDENITCYSCPIGTTYNGENGCELMTGYSWQNDIDTRNNLYNTPSTISAYYYNESNVAIGCNNGYYNIGDEQCTQCPDNDGINCHSDTDRPFDNANRTLEPNYSWDGTTATKCPKDYKREGYVAIDSSDITCNPCLNNLNNSDYNVDDEGNQLYDIYGFCVWSCERGYELNDNKCLKQCQAGEKRIEIENTCEPCGVDTYKERTHTDTSCSSCPIGSTTNSNTGSTSIDSCIARPGYGKETDYNYTPKPGNLDEESPLGIIDRCEYNYGFNTGKTECTSCPLINNGQYNMSQNPSNCTNIICNPGYKFDNESCQPCGINRYKQGTNNDNECSECPIGSTTGNNNTAIAITDCTAKPGYKKVSDNSYTLEAGNLDNESPTGEIDNCDNGYYYDGALCISCFDYGDGIECDGGTLNNSKRILKPGYSWNNSTAQPCDNKYRLGKVEIQDGQLINCTDCPVGTTYNGDNGCELNTGYSWEVDHIEDYLYITPDKNNDAYYYENNVAEGCQSGHYYNTSECKSCSDFDIGVQCPGGAFENAFRYLKPGYKWISQLQISEECDKNSYRSNNENNEDEKINDSSIDCNDSCDSNETINPYRTGCIDKNGYTYYSKDNEVKDFYCSGGYYYSYSENSGDGGDGECIQCGNEKNAITCNGGNDEGERGIKILNGGWEKIQDELTECGINYYRQESDYNGENITCIPCEYGFTTNGEIGQSECIEQCSSDNEYYDETYCPENSNYDDSGNCICNTGYLVNTENNGCEVSSPTMKIVGERCSSDDECYSGICKEKNSFYLQKVCKGRAYGEQCMSAKQQCRSSHHCVNNSCGPVKRGGSCNNGEECEQGTECSQPRRREGRRWKPVGGLICT